MAGLSRRGLARVSIGAVAAAAMLGRPGRSLAQDAKRLRFGGYVESQEQLQQTLAVLKRYEELHPGVTINPEFTSFGSFTDKLATEATGGNAPDMFSVNLDLMGEYSRRGVIQPLDQFVPKPLDLADYVQSAVQANTRDGHLWSIPNDCVSPVLVYATAPFEKAGIPVPEQMWTWEKYAETSIALHKALGPRFWGTEDGGGSYIMLDLYLRAQGKMFFTADRKLGFKLPDLTEWLVYWQKMRDAGGVPPGDIQALATGDDLSRTGLISGRAAMLPQLTDAYVGLQNLTDAKLGMNMMPNGFASGEMKSHHYAYAGNSTAVWTKTPHTDLVIDIVRFMQMDPVGAGIFYNGSGMVPASAAGREWLAREGSDADRRVLDYIAMVQKGNAPPRNPNFPGVSGVLRRMNETVAFGKAKPEQAAADFIAEAERRIKV
jgi:multiple sugar transport system substrate-binding protein